VLSTTARHEHAEPMLQRGAQRDVRRSLIDVAVVRHRVAHVEIMRLVPPHPPI
jgi:hypothetical protein